MTSFLVIAKTPHKRREYIDAFCKERNINTFDITVIEKEETKQSLGIDDIKRMQKKIFLKPVRSKTKAVILEDSQLLTIEAQNAMLKMLEEPPEHTIIILAADSEESLLPTIHSRCQIIRLKEEIRTLSEKDEQEIKQFIENLNRLTIPQTLKLAEILAKDKQEAIKWIENVILMSREQLLHTMVLVSDERSVSGINPEQARNIIKAFQNLHTLLKTTNVNPRFAIEHTLLTLIY